MGVGRVGAVGMIGDRTAVTRGVLRAEMTPVVTGLVGGRIGWVMTTRGVPGAAMATGGVPGTAMTTGGVPGAIDDNR